MPTVGLAERPETIHDFWGFPEPLYQMRYPATGCREAALEVRDAIAAAGLPVNTSETQGLDHGAWIPLRLMYPDADIPVIPLSIQSAGGSRQAYALGQSLAGLVKRGFLVIASGNLTHNLMDFRMAHAQGGQTPAYVGEFAEWFASRLERNDTAALLDYRNAAPAAARAHPTDEHLLPIYVALGAAGDAPRAERLHAGIDNYVISMDAWQFWPQ